VHFLENHDEARMASILPFAEHRAAALLVAGLPGMRLIHEGQLEGLRERVSVHLGRRAPEKVDRDVAQFYERLFAACAETAVGRGLGQLLEPRSVWTDDSTHRNLALVQWQSESSAFDLVVVNLAAERSRCCAPLSVPRVAECNWRMRDALGTEEYERNGNELATRGLYLDVAPHAAHLFHFAQAWSAF
jgi:hypothetical protein